MKNHQGFTILEFMIATVILAILVGGMMRVLLSVQDAREAGFQKTEMQANGRAGMEMFVREARMAGANLPSITIRAYRNGAPYTINPVVPYPTTINQDSVMLWTSYDNIKVGFDVIGNGSGTELRCTDIGNGSVNSFANGDMMILWDTLTNTADMCMVTNVQGSAGHLQQTPSSPYANPYINRSNYPNGGVALRLHGIMYYISQDSTSHWVFYRRDGGHTAQGLSDNITQLQLAYYDYLDNPLSAPFDDTTKSKIRRIDVTLQAVPRILNWAKHATSFSLHTSAQVRSL
jgi:prepilin-type N-terminal cleavage/methylation domain-containing protein